MVARTKLKLKVPTYVENLKAGNIKHTDEHSASLTSLKGHVTLLDQPSEGTREETLGHSTDLVGHLVDIHTLGDKLSTDLYLGLAVAPVQLISVNTEQLGNNLTSLRKEKGNAEKRFEGEMVNVKI